MITLTSTDKGKLEAALLRGSELVLTPVIQDRVGCYYHVQSGANRYDVAVAKTDGKAAATCTCVAGSKNQTCKHSARVLKAYKAFLAPAAVVDVEAERQKKLADDHALLFGF